MKYFQFCQKLNIEPNIDKIQLEDLRFQKVNDWKNKLIYLNKEYIEIFNSDKNKCLFSDIITSIYSILDIKYLISLIKSDSKNNFYYISSLFNLLDKNFITRIDFIFDLEKEEIIIIQEKLFTFANNKDKINKIIQLSIGITSCLEFIDSKKEKICQILSLQPSSSIFKKENYELHYVEPSNKSNEDTLKIYLALLSIIQFTKKNNIVIININNIFQSLVNFYYNGELIEFLNLQTIEQNLNNLKINDISKEKLEDYHKKIHEKGMNLIRLGQMKKEEILYFMQRDFYYFDSQYENSDLRDPNIFQYILITDEENRKIIKDMNDIKLDNLFNKSKKEIKQKYYRILVEQMKKISDFIFIFEFFSIENIDKEFVYIINDKLELLIDKAKFEQDEKLIYSVLNNWIIINCINNINISNILIRFDNKLKSNYFSILIKNKDMEKYIIQFKDIIVPFVLNNNKSKNGNAETIIYLLLNFDNNELRCDILSELSDRDLKNKDFYCIGENDDFLLYKLFFEKCQHLFNLPEINTSTYFLKITSIRSKLENDLKNKDVEYNIIKKIIEVDKNGEFLDKIKVVIQNEEQSINIYKELLNDFGICQEKFKELENIVAFYQAFFLNSKENEIKIIINILKEYQVKNISEIIQVSNFFEKDNNLLESSSKYLKKIEYKNSIIFLALYDEINKNQKSEEEIFDLTVENYKSSLSLIINQKETKDSFFKIKYVNKIIEVIKRNLEHIEKEIIFTLNEFKYLEKDDYIKNELINDIINFSKQDEISKFMFGMIKFIKIINQIRPIKKTEFSDKLNKIFLVILSENVSGEEISNSLKDLNKIGFEFKEESNLMKFFQSFDEDALLFLDDIKKNKIDIRSLNEFIVVEGENTDIQTSDIENLISIYQFFTEIIGNDNLETDEKVIEFLKNKFDNNILSYFENYQNNYGEIKRIYLLYEKNPDTVLNIINNILKKSNVEFFKDDLLDLMTFNIFLENEPNQDEKICDNSKKQNNGKFKMKKKEIKPKEVEDLGNKIILLMNNYQIQNEKNEKLDKNKICNNFIILIDNIKHLVKSLNSLMKSGYPHIEKFSLKIINSKAKDENGRQLEELVKDYNNKNKNFKKLIINSYEKYPYLRLFYGKQFKQLFDKAKYYKGDISNLISAVTLNKIKEYEFNYIFNKEYDELTNINNYLEKLFEINKTNISDIYEQNKVIDNKLSPGLFRKKKIGNNDDIANNYNILNIYLNLTKHPPIINTLLNCNEETFLEKIISFFYKALLCKKPILFVISNLECLELSIIQSSMKIFKALYNKINKEMNSYLIFIYKKVDTGLARDIEKLIQEQNILSDIYLKSPKMNEIFKNTEIYTSEYCGYGKSTEIKYKVKNNNGIYCYFPIGGSFRREYILNNLINLKTKIDKGNSSYLHLDLSNTDNDNLMNEILFKLIILRYVDSFEKIYYIGHDINIIIEIPNGFVELYKKFKFLKLFHRTHIKKLNPLRLEENAKKIYESPISIVAEILTLYDRGEIETKDINLNDNITKSAAECEKIINKYFIVENNNYYQKMNFIKILSLQFKKFTENIYFNYNIALDTGRELVISNIRKLIISNFISLSKIFTSSPFDSVLLKKIDSIDLFGKYDEALAIKEGMNDLANEKIKKQIFSFEKIKPSLVFFNLDNQSLSIISNEDKNKEEYKNLKILWNSSKQKALKFDFLQWIQILKHENFFDLDDLIDYKSLNHESFLEQIKILFNLNNLKIEDLKKICEQQGNYIFVSDNFIKMVRILLNIEAKIPVILMGETGVGKTKLLEMLSILCGKGESNWKKLQIHAGITDENIINFIENITQEFIKNKKEKEEKRKKEEEKGKKEEEKRKKEEEKGKKEEEKGKKEEEKGKKVEEKGKKEEEKGKKEEKEEIVWVFFDEINTCNSLGLISEIMCKHTYLGKKIMDNIVFLAACNPYKTISKKMKECGLTYYNMEKDNKLNNLVYSVNILPHSLLNFIFDFGSLQKNDEEKYISNTIQSVLSSFKKENIINIDEDNFNLLEKEIIESIIICHDFIRSKYDKSSVSLREIRRFSIFFKYFINYLKENIDQKDNTYQNLKNSLNLTLYLCYYLRLNDKKDRKELCILLNKIFGDFLNVPKNIVKSLTEQMIIGKGIALNRALKENLFTCFTCADNLVPLIIVGKPGTGKSLSCQILYNTLIGEFSKSEIFKKKGKLYTYYYQGSEASTSKGIEEIFQKAVDAKKKNIKNKIIPMVIFDEMGLAERSINNPLKVMHHLLEKDNDESVPFVGISNWRLDAAKINRALNLLITDFDKEDYEETSVFIAKNLDEYLANRYKNFFLTLANVYNEYISNSQKSLLRENKDFHGNRDFYNLIKTAMYELINKRKDLEVNEQKVLTEIGLFSLNRNFGGLENINSSIIDIFKKLYGYNFDESVEINKKFSVLDAI